MAAEVVVTLYRAGADQEEALEALLRARLPHLRATGLTTSRTSLLLRSRVDGSFLEVVEWSSPEAKAVGWGEWWPRLEALGEIFTLGDLANAAPILDDFALLDRLA